MSDLQHQTPSFPRVADLAERFAVLVADVATQRQRETGWSREQAVSVVRAAAVAHVERLAEVLVEATEMALDLWEATP